jgi:hypothetical protein
MFFFFLISKFWRNVTKDQQNYLNLHSKNKTKQKNQNFPNCFVEKWQNFTRRKNTGALVDSCTLIKTNDIMMMMMMMMMMRVQWHGD